MTQPKLYLKLESDASILSDFYSGIEAMDSFIHSRLSAFLRAYKCRFYVLRNEAGIVVSEGRLVLDEDCKDDLHMKFPDIDKWPDLKDYWEVGIFPSIEIHYLAVSKDYQRQHIGKDIISIIGSFKDDSFYHHPLFLSVAAYHTNGYSAVGFYSKCRFLASELMNQSFETLRMFETK